MPGSGLHATEGHRGGRHRLPKQLACGYARFAGIPIVPQYRDVMSRLMPSLVGTACGSNNGGQVDVTTPEPALAPAGPNARTIGYTCARSSGNTILVELQNLDELAGLVNAINLCEFDGGLDEITVEVLCPKGTRTITVLTVGGKVTDRAVMDACEQT